MKSRGVMLFIMVEGRDDRPSFDEFAVCKGFLLFGKRFEAGDMRAFKIEMVLSNKTKVVLTNPMSFSSRIAHINKIIT